MDIQYTYEMQKKRVYQFTKDGYCIKYFDGVREAGRRLNIQPNNIVQCCKFKRRSAGGFLWSYTRDVNYSKRFGLIPNNL